MGRAGLATQVQRRIGKSLMYGLWEHDMLREIVWEMKTGGTRTNLDMPTWCWLSVLGEVGNPSTGRDSFVTSATWAPFGTKDDKKIVLNGPLLNVHVSTFAIETATNDESAIIYKGSWKPDVRPVANTEAASLLVGYWTGLKKVYVMADGRDLLANCLRSIVCFQSEIGTRRHLHSRYYSFPPQTTQPLYCRAGCLDP
jgi:hypothetical protein